MDYKKIGDREQIVHITSEEVMIWDTESALDFIMTVQYETNCNCFIIGKEAFCEDFFSLKTGIAGEILQKFINYHIRIAIVGDYSQYNSKALHDFIYECNKGKDIFFVTDVELGIERIMSKEV